MEQSKQPARKRLIDERTEAQASLYALGRLPPEEARQFEEEMGADPRLRTLVEELRGPKTTPTPAPADPGTRAEDPARLPGWAAWMPWALAACFAVLCVVLITVGKNLRQQALGINERLEQSTAEVAELNRRLEELQSEASSNSARHIQRVVNIETQALTRIAELGRQTAAITNQLFREQNDMRRRLTAAEDDVRRYASTNQALLAAILSGGSSPGGSDRYSSARLAFMQPTVDGPPATVGAAVWVGQDRRGLLALEKLPPVRSPATQDYQLWLFSPDVPTPVGVGVFQPDAVGSVRLQFASAVVRTVDKFAVTLERKGGTPQPTGRILLQSN